MAHLLYRGSRPDSRRRSPALKSKMAEHHGGIHTRAGAAVLATLALLGTGCGARRVPLPQLAETTPGNATVARGEYVVRTVAVCGHCHAADPKRDPDGALSGGMVFRNWRL